MKEDKKKAKDTLYLPASLALHVRRGWPFMERRPGWPLQSVVDEADGA